jgi:predicted dehydrogenase
MSQSPQFSRRTFVKSVAYAGMTIPLASCATSVKRSVPVNGQVRFAFVATGGRGGAHVNAYQKQPCLCYSDVDRNAWATPAKYWPNAKAYQDWRQMYDKHSKDFDAICIATPDHCHFHAALYAMQMGKHVYVEKPLTHSIWEARMLTVAAKKYNVATQMGNQGHSGEGWRLFMEWVKAGAIGEIKDVHTWTNRPIWPQGLPRPQGSSPVPENLNWDVWIGPAPFRPYVHEENREINGKKTRGDVYHPFSWRGRVDFGSGALGDMACHTMDGIQWVMNPGYPTAVEAIKIEGPAPDGDSFPNASVIRYEFPATKEHGAWTHTWYDGGLKPDRPAELDEKLKMPNSGNLVIGTKGKILISGDYGDSPRIIPQAKMDEFINRFPDRKAPQLFERVKPMDTTDPKVKIDPHHADFLRAIMTGGEAGSNFGYAGPFTEVVQLGNVALRAGKRIEWDGENMRAKNVSGIDHLIHRQYRKGWEVTSI